MRTYKRNTAVANGGTMRRALQDGNVLESGRYVYIYKRAPARALMKTRSNYAARGLITVFSFVNKSNRRRCRGGAVALRRKALAHLLILLYTSPLFSPPPSSFRLCINILMLCVLPPCAIPSLPSAPHPPVLSLSDK